MPPPIATSTPSMHHRARGDRDRLQAGGALPVDGGAGDRDRKAGADRALAGDVHHHGALLHGAAHHHVLDLAGRDAGALDRFGDHMAGQGRAFGIVERAAIGLADAGAGGGNDNCFSVMFASCQAAASSCAKRSTWKAGSPNWMLMEEIRLK